MVKRDPDDLISALSKNLKGQNSPVLRITFKRGGLWQPQHAKAHKRTEKLAIKEKLRKDAQNDDKYKQNLSNKQQSSVLRLNAATKSGRGQKFIEQMLSVFRVNFFKKKEQQKQKKIPEKSKPNPQSKSSLRKQAKKQRNKARKDKYKQLRKAAKKEAKKTKTISKS